jgi:hypothetical protein
MVSIQAAEPPTAGDLADGRGIVIVPLEPPPLALAPGIDMGSALAMNTGVAMSLIPDSGTASAGRGLAAVSGIVMLATLPEQSRRAAQVASAAEGALTASGAWIPTVELAKGARQLLVQSGHEGVRISDHLQPIPGIEKRERTITMHNWYGPINHWYRTDRTPFAYAEPEVASGELVLEVAISNYELETDGQMFLFIATHLVDPATGRVLKRARKMVYDHGHKLGTLFAGDASGFKTAFNDLARRALADDLRAIGYDVR